MRNAFSYSFKLPGNAAFQTLRAPYRKNTNVLEKGKKKVNVPVVFLSFSEVSSNPLGKSAHRRANVDIETLREKPLTETPYRNKALFRKVSQKEVTPPVFCLPFVHLPGNGESMRVLEASVSLPAYCRRLDDNIPPSRIESRSKRRIRVEIREKSKARGRMSHEKNCTSKLFQALHMLPAPSCHGIREHRKTVKKEGTGFDLKEEVSPLSFQKEIETGISKSNLLPLYPETCKTLEAILLKELPGHKSRKTRVEADYLFPYEGTPNSRHFPPSAVLKEEYSPGKENLPQSARIGQMGREPPPICLAEDHKAVQAVKKERLLEHNYTSIRALRLATIPAPTIRGIRAKK